MYAGEGIEKNYRLKPYRGNPYVRNFRGGAGNRPKASRTEVSFPKGMVIATESLKVLRQRSTRQSARTVL